MRVDGRVPGEVRILLRRDLDMNAATDATEKVLLKIGDVVVVRVESEGEAQGR